MRTKASLFLGALLLTCSATIAGADQYPPGPGGLFPDTLINVSFIQDPAAVPHPVAPDTVWGIGGIITGFDAFPTGFAIYIQQSNGGPWTGVDIFTGGTNYINLPQFHDFGGDLALGDSIMCYGRLDEFQSGGELRGFDPNAFNAPLVAVRRISQGNPLPPWRRTTVAELQELPTNPTAEQWEGCLVRVNHKVRTVRTSLQNGIGTFSSWIVVDNTLCPNGSLGPCDSLFVDGSTLSFNAVSPPPLGALADSVQGIYDQRTRGYRIQLRDGQDLFDSSPPSISDAFAFTADSVRVVFDRNLTLASAQNLLNYTLSSTLGPPDAAVRQLSHNVVHLKVTNGLAPCDPEGITVNGLVTEVGNNTMTSAGTRSWANGICPIASLQAPDPVALALSPCDDRSKFAGAGATPGGRMTTRGVCTLLFGSTYWIETAAAGTRSGLIVFAPTTVLVAGHQYVIAGAIQEFFGETELVSTQFIKDEGVVAAPAPIIQTVGVLRDTTCDAGQSNSTGEDYEGVLVKVVDVRTVDERTAGQSFFVAGPYPSNPDTILIDNNVVRTFDPTKNQYVTVTGVLDLSFGTWRIQPRSNSDIVVNPTLDVGDQLPEGVSFAVTPNPARASHITFALPKRDRVQIGVYDLAGRRLAVLADGEFPAGTHTLDWNGRDIEGNEVGSGVYFYKLKVSGQTFNRRGVLIN
jgi:hypothetical protein